MIARPPLLEAMMLSGNALLLEVPAAARSTGPVTQAPFQCCKPSSYFTQPRAPIFNSGNDARVALDVMQYIMRGTIAIFWPRQDLGIKTFIRAVR